MKFKPFQRIIIKNFMINGSRLDISGVVNRYVLNRTTKEWRVECIINSTFVLLEESRIMDYDEYHKNKKESSDEPR